MVAFFPTKFPFFTRKKMLFAYKIRFFQQQRAEKAFGKVYRKKTAEEGEEEGKKNEMK